MAAPASFDLETPASFDLGTPGAPLDCDGSQSNMCGSMSGGRLQVTSQNLHYVNFRRREAKRSLTVGNGTSGRSCDGRARTGNAARTPAGTGLR
jgi:hypothetical protein